MRTIPEMAAVRQGLCGETAERLGRESGFIQRQRVFSWLSKSPYARALIPRSYRSAGPSPVQPFGLARRRVKSLVFEVPLLWEFRHDTFKDWHRLGGGLAVPVINDRAKPSKFGH